MKINYDKLEAKELREKMKIDEDENATFIVLLILVLIISNFDSNSLLTTELKIIFGFCAMILYFAMIYSLYTFSKWKDKVIKKQIKTGVIK